MTGRGSLIAAVVCLMWAVTSEAQAPVSNIRKPTILPITSVTVTGNQRIGTEAILGVLNLKVKENGSAAIFDAARDRLLNTGYFDSVSYSYRQQDLGFAITYTVAEMKQVYPIFAEGLPVTTEKVAEILKAKDPFFQGLMPGTKTVVDRAAAAVEEGLGVHVRARVIPTGPDHYEVQFSPAEGLPVIADMTFEGSKVASDADLHTVMIENGIGQPFSEVSVRDLLDRYVRPKFEKEGYMRVSFPKIESKPAKDVKGIDVHVTVVDGPQFKLGNVSVRGPMVGDSKRIIRMANLPTEDFANMDALAAGAKRIHDVLSGEGYIDVSVTSGRSIIDASKTVDAWFDVNPGAQYTFGRLAIQGLGLDGEAAIRKMWGIKAGDPYPGTYPEHFVQSVKDEGLFDNLGGITATPAIDHERHVVDVTLSFAGAVPKPRKPVSR